VWFFCVRYGVFFWGGLRVGTFWVGFVFGLGCWGLFRGGVWGGLHPHSAPIPALPSPHIPRGRKGEEQKTGRTVVVAPVDFGGPGGAKPGGGGIGKRMKKEGRRGKHDIPCGARRTNGVGKGVRTKNQRSCLRKKSTRSEKTWRIGCGVHRPTDSKGRGLKYVTDYHPNFKSPSKGGLGGGSISPSAVRLSAYWHLAGPDLYGGIVDRPSQSRKMRSRTIALG